MGWTRKMHKNICKKFEGFKILGCFLCGGHLKNIYASGGSARRPAHTPICGAVSHRAEHGSWIYGLSDHGLCPVFVDAEKDSFSIHPVLSGRCPCVWRILIHLDCKKCLARHGPDYWTGSGQTGYDDLSDGVGGLSVCGPCAGSLFEDLETGARRLSPERYQKGLSANIIRSQNRDSSSWSSAKRTGDVSRRPYPRSVYKKGGVFACIIGEDPAHQKAEGDGGMTTDCP